MQALKGGTEAMTLGKFFPLIFKSWFLTYAVKIGEIWEIPPAKEYFISTVYVHLWLYCYKHKWD